LPDEFFNLTPNISLLNQVVLAQLAAARARYSKCKTRNEVSGGGKKPWAQKGTGNARAGSSRSPIWRGGGMTHAVKPRKYDQKTPKKMIRAALLQALSDRAQDNKIVIIDNWNLGSSKN
jgi:large subunit ribosomal protein L4